MRKATSTMGLTSCTPILIHKKDELQITPRAMKAIQCFVFKISCFLKLVVYVVRKPTAEDGRQTAVFGSCLMKLRMFYACFGCQFATARLNMINTAPTIICQVSGSLRKTTPRVTPPSGMR